jgi:hypothetical protein
MTQTVYQPRPCRHCGAAMIEVVTSMKYNTRGLVCSQGWNAVYRPDALPCGAAAAMMAREAA